MQGKYTESITELNAYVVKLSSMKILAILFLLKL